MRRIGLVRGEAELVLSCCDYQKEREGREGREKRVRVEGDGGRIGRV